MDSWRNVRQAAPWLGVCFFTKSTSFTSQKPRFLLRHPLKRKLSHVLEGATNEDLNCASQNLLNLYRTKTLHIHTNPKAPW